MNHMKKYTVEVHIALFGMVIESITLCKFSSQLKQIHPSLQLQFLQNVRMDKNNNYFWTLCQNVFEATFIDIFGIHYIILFN